jgi:hypothetical protein
VLASRPCANAEKETSPAPADQSAAGAAAEARDRSAGALASARDTISGAVRSVEDRAAAAFERTKGEAAPCLAGSTPELALYGGHRQAGCCLMAWSLRPDLSFEVCFFLLTFAALRTASCPCRGGQGGAGPAGAEARVSRGRPPHSRQAASGTAQCRGMAAGAQSYALRQPLMYLWPAGRV